jgi:hypothetical protein
MILTLFCMKSSQVCIFGFCLKGEFFFFISHSAREESPESTCGKSMFSLSSVSFFFVLYDKAPGKRGPIQEVKVVLW